MGEERSKTKQDFFNKQINSEAAKFYKEELIPQLNIEMKEKLGDGEWISVDTEDEMVVNFYWTSSLLESNYQKNMTTRADILCRKRIDELFSSIEHENPKLKKLAFG